MGVNGVQNGFLGALAILFIALKLTAVIDWSWWWVLAPLWGPFALIIGMMAVALLIAGVAAALPKSKPRWLGD